MQVLQSIDEVTKKLGGTLAVAGILNVSPKAVYQWKQEGKFPARTYVAFKTLLEKEGCDAPLELWGMTSPPQMGQAS